MQVVPFLSEIPPTLLTFTSFLSFPLDYTNLSHSDALETLALIFPEELIAKPHVPPLLVLHHHLNFVIANNVFEFSGYFCRQHHGVAMGTKLSLAVATLYLAH